MKVAASGQTRPARISGHFCSQSYPPPHTTAAMSPPRPLIDAYEWEPSADRRQLEWEPSILFREAEQVSSGESRVNTPPLGARLSRFPEHEAITMNDPIDWLRAITGESSLRGISDKVGRSPSTVHRWLREGIPAPAVIGLATDHGTDVIQALVATGWLTEAEAEAVNLNETIKSVPTIVLTAELHRRAKAQKARAHFE